MYVISVLWVLLQSTFIFIFSVACCMFPIMPVFHTLRAKLIHVYFCFLPESKLSIALDTNSTCAKVAFFIISRSMNSPSPQFVPSRLGIYEPIHQIGMWGETFKSNGNPNTSTSVIIEVDNKLENEVKILEI